MPVTGFLHSLFDRDLLSCRTTAAPEDIRRAVADLPRTLSQDGIGEEASTKLLLDTIAPALAPGQAGPRYFGFVTGGRTPISLAADALVSSYDANVQVHLPNETVATHVESLALDLVLNLLDIPPKHFPGRTVTTGATASNVLGLALGREYVVRKIKGPDFSVAEEGLGAVQTDVYAAGSHASIKKAAALVGIGRSRVIEVTDDTSSAPPAAFDFEKLQSLMQTASLQHRGVVVCPSYGEVNTGAFTPEMHKLRALCDKYGAWLHLDAAFGGFGALHPEFSEELKAGMMLADSLTLDGHKWLNVPYDCGLFYNKSSKLQQDVFGPGGVTPAYLSTGASDIPSPLNVGIENSRRFRALPLYCSLICHGKQGYIDIVQRNIEFAREVERWLKTEGQAYYDVLTPPSTSSSDHGNFRLLNIVLFAPSKGCGVEKFLSADGGLEMCKAINETGEIYVTGTKWKGRTAARLAVSNWQTGTRSEDMDIVKRRLLAIMKA